MGFKKMDSSLGFADFALASSLKHNRSLKLMEKLDKSIEWPRIKSILMGHYTVGSPSMPRGIYFFLSFINYIRLNILLVLLLQLFG